MGRLEFSRGAHARAADLMRESLAMRVALLGPDHPATRLSRANLAAVLGRLGRHAEAETLLREVLADAGTSTSRRATAMANLADVLMNQGKLRAAEAMARDALALRADDPLGEASSLSVLGQVLTRLRRFPEARECLQRSLDIRVTRLGAQHPHVARTRDHLAAIPD
jgi:tetratricopeptide (TPR) repeat protein